MSAFPGPVGLAAFNPFIPLNDRDSSIPVAMFEIAFTNPTDADRLHGRRRPRPRPPPADQGRPRRSAGHARRARSSPTSRISASRDYAELVLATDSPVTSRQTHLFRGHWFDALEVYWKDLQPARPVRRARLRHQRHRRRHGAEPRFEPRRRAHHRGAGRDGDRALSLIAWYAPNFRKYWVTPVWHFRQASGAQGQWRNWYATEWSGANQVAQEVLSRWDALQGDDVRLPRRGLFIDPAACRARRGRRQRSDPEIADDAPARRTAPSTAGKAATRTPAAAREAAPMSGTTSRRCPSCFPALERSMREVDYTHNMNAAGGLSFRLSLPLGTDNSTERPCADGQFGNVLKLYRDWKLSGDTDWLRQPLALREEEPRICLEPGEPGPLGSGPDRRPLGPPAPHARHGAVRPELVADRLLSRRAEGGVRDGRRRSATMRRRASFTPRSSRRAAPGSTATSSTASTSSRRSTSAIAPSSRPLPRRKSPPASSATASRRFTGATSTSELKYQLGDGCLVDQVLGQWHADLYGLGEIFDPRQDRDEPGGDLPPQFRPPARRHLQPLPGLRPLRRGRHRDRHVARSRRRSRPSPCPTRRRPCTAWSTPSRRC